MQQTTDRFSWAVAGEPQEPQVVAECATCNIELYDFQKVWVIDGEIFCDGDCIAAYYGADRKTAKEAVS